MKKNKNKIVNTVLNFVIMVLIGIILGYLAALIKYYGLVPLFGLHINI